MTSIAYEQMAGLVYGTLVGDALAMPVHWYYDREALHRDYGEVRDYLAPRNPHPGSILWRSNYQALNAKGEILHDQARYWGQQGVHYHQNLKPGENTLNLQLGRVLANCLTTSGSYDPDLYLKRFAEFMLTPGRHRDTYIEECHRNFFTRYAQGKPLRKCGGEDIHIGGLAHVGILCAWLANDETAARAAVRTHVSLTHNSPDVLKAADDQARILMAVLRGRSLEEAITNIANEWLPPKQAQEWLRHPDSVIVGQRFSTACYIRESFPATLYLALKYSEDIQSGLVANTNLGGDNCHRGAVLGALLGAANGFTKIPQRWRDGLMAKEELHGLCEAAARPNQLLHHK